MYIRIFAPGQISMASSLQSAVIVSDNKDLQLARYKLVLFLLGIEKHAQIGEQ